MKQLRLLITICALVISTFLHAKVVSGKCGPKLTWTFNTETGLLKIEGSGGMNNYGRDYIYSPWFSYRNNILALELREGLTKIGEYAFFECSRLTSISIPNSVTSIGDYAFFGCSGLTSISIPNSVTSIGGSAFKGCSGLTSISIPNSITSIGGAAFQGCSGLNDPIIVNDMFVYLPKTFKGTYSIPSNITKIVGGAFFGCRDLTSVYISNSVTSIGGYAFYECSRLTSISIPNSVTSIGDYAFFGCSGLTSISIPNSVTSIGSSAFCKCSGMTSISIPNSVTNISYGTFACCSGLTSISIPNSVTSIGDKAFEDCSGIQNFSITGENPPQRGGSNIFNNVDLSNATLYVPADKVTYYQTTEPWTKFGTVKTLSGETLSTPTACAKPTIAYKDGQLAFSSATTGAKYHCTITSPDMKSDVPNESGTMNLDARYDIAVYATAEGYTQSETAMAALYWVKADGSLTDNINAARMRGVVVTADNGFVSVSGLNDGEQVLFYGTDGKMLGSQKAVNGTASLSTSESVVICKVGTTSLKVLVK